MHSSWHWNIWLVLRSANRTDDHHVRCQLCRKSPPVSTTPGKWNAQVGLSMGNKLSRFPFKLPASPEWHPICLSEACFYKNLRVHSVCPKIHSNPKYGGFQRHFAPQRHVWSDSEMLVRYERFGGILHEDCVFMDAVRRFHAPIRQRASIFVRKNTQKYLQKLLIRSPNDIYWRYSEFSGRHYIHFEL